MMKCSYIGLNVSVKVCMQMQTKAAGKSNGNPWKINDLVD